MTIEPTAKTFMFILRGGKANRDMSLTEQGLVLQKYISWIESLKNSGCYRAGEPLEEEAKVVSGKNGKLVTDGPFTESKEAIGGYFMVAARDLTEAVEIATGCPIFDNNGTVEVRQIAVIPRPED